MVIKTKAPAKINLTLEVVQKLDNGFHELRSVALKLENIYDEVEVSFLEKGNDVLIMTDSKNIPIDERNICYKAAKRYLQEIGNIGTVEIRLKKKIPVGAGMGGGSSDAAEVFKSLNKICGQVLSEDQLIKISAEIGKDIPIFIAEKNCVLMEGMGEKITQKNYSRQVYFLIINPKLHITTKDAYQKLSELLWFCDDKNRVNISQEMFVGLDDMENSREVIVMNLYNDFEIFAERKYPIIKEIKQALLAFGADNSLMTGSGSTVFGIFSEEANAKKAKTILAEKYPEFFIEISR